jgi:tripartite-type tricarboxylate transporter receptor subunit TctC
MTNFTNCEGRVCALAAVAVVTILLTHSTAHAQAQSDKYPSKNIKFIVPAPPGGPADFTARVLSEKLTQRLGQSVIVFNRGGAGTKLGQQEGARAVPDGYTITYGTQALSIAPHISHMDFDPVKDIIPVSNVVGYAVALVIRSEFPANSLKEFVAYAKAKPPGAMTYGSTGVGGLSHLQSEMLANAIGVKFTMVPYSGGAQFLTAVLGGQIDWVVDTLGTSVPHIKAGRLKALAYSGAKRHPMIPNVPTFSETIPGFVSTGWFGVTVPKGTPRPIVDLLSKNIQEIMHEPALNARLVDAGFEVIGDTPENFAKFIRDQIGVFGKIIKDADIKDPG